MNKLFLIVACAGFTLVLSQCSKSAKEITTFDCAGTAASYASDVKGILDASCATSGCHSASSKANGIDLSSYDAAKSAAGDKSFLGSVQHVSGYDKMPKGGSKLADDKVKTLSCWVQNNMPQ